MSTGAKENDPLLDAVALLVLDVQERLLPAMADGEAFTDRVAFVLEAARIFNIRVIFTEQVPEKLGPTLPALKRLAPNARVFRKSSFSALQAKGLQDYLRELNIYHLLVCGLETPVCIYQTALQAADLDLDTTLLSDCLASRRPEDDAFILPSLTRSGCHILPAETVFYSMLADATHPRFRAFSDLVKRHDALRRGEILPPARAEAPAPPANRKAETALPTPTTPSPEAQPVAKSDEAPCATATPGGDPTPARPKHGRGRRRKAQAPAPEETRTREAPANRASESQDADPSPGAPSAPTSSAEADADAPKKPRRRRRGPRKPKSAPGETSPGKPGGPANDRTADDS